MRAAKEFLSYYIQSIEVYKDFLFYIEQQSPNKN